MIRLHRLLLPCWVTVSLLIASNAVSLGAQVKTIAAGAFTMGSVGGSSDEQPLRTVAVEGFTISAHEVTEAEYEECVARGGCTPAHYDDSTCRVWNGTSFMKVIVPASARNPRNPVVCVTWQQARAFCRSHNMALPTEIQWEYAARAGSSGPTPWGGAAPSSRQCVAGRKDGPQPAGTCDANAWGLSDMLGNSWEWVHDWYDAQAYSYDAALFPQGPEAGIYRVIRGGGWYSTAADLAFSNRQWFSPDYSEVSIGFRCAGR